MSISHGFLSTFRAFGRLVLIAVLSFHIGGQFLIYSAYFQDDESGVYREDFLGNDSGIQSTQDVNIDLSAGLVMQEGGTQSQVVLSDIEVTSIHGRTQIQVDGINTENNVTVTVNDCNGSSLLTSTVDDSGIIDITTIPSSIPCITVQADWTDATTMLSDIYVRWIPLPVFLLDLQGEDTIPAGECNVHDIFRSLSYVDEQDTVLYLELPSIDNGTLTGFTPTYGQYPDTHGLAVSSITNGGEYTDSEITINNVLVPANSLYWDIGVGKLGSSYKYSVVLCSDNLSENSIDYTLNAHILGALAEDKSDTLSSMVTSTPNPILNPDSPSVAYIGGGTDFVAGDASSYEMSIDGDLTNKVVTYVMSVTNPVEEFGVEDIFNPSLTLDFSDASAGLTAGGCDVTDIQSRAILADGWSWIDAITATYDYAQAVETWSTASGVINNQYQDAFIIDYTGCTETNDTYNVVLEWTGDNMTVLNYTYAVSITAESFSNGECGDGIVNQSSEQCDMTDLSGCSNGQLCSSGCQCYSPTTGGGGGGGTPSACEGACWYNKCVTTDYDYENNGGYVSHDNTICYNGFKAGSADPFKGPDPVTGDHPYTSASFYYNDFVYSLSVVNQTIYANSKEPRRSIFMLDDFQNDMSNSADLDWILEEVWVEGYQRGRSSYLTTNTQASEAYYNDRSTQNFENENISWDEWTDANDWVKIYMNDNLTPVVPTIGVFNGLGGEENMPTSIGTGWVETMALEDVKSLGAYIPCLNHGSDPAIPGTSCDGAPENVTVKFRVRRDDSSNQMCNDPLPDGFSIINDSELYQFHQQVTSLNDDQIESTLVPLVDDDKGVQVNVLDPYVFPTGLPSVNQVYNDTFASGSQVGLISSEFQLKDSMVYSFDSDGDIQGLSLNTDGMVIIDMPEQCGENAIAAVNAAYSLEGYEKTTTSILVNDSCNQFGSAEGLINEWKENDIIPQSAENVSCEYKFNINQGYLISCGWDLNGQHSTTLINLDIASSTTEYLWFTPYPEEFQNELIIEGFLLSTINSFSECVDVFGEKDCYKEFNFALESSGCGEYSCQNNIQGATTLDDYASCTVPTTCTAPGAEIVYSREVPAPLPQGAYLEGQSFDYSAETIDQFSQCIFDQGYLTYPQVSNNGPARSYTVTIDENGVTAIDVEYDTLVNPQTTSATVDGDGDIDIPVYVPARNGGGTMDVQVAYEYASGACLSDDMQAGVGFEVTNYVREGDIDCRSIADGDIPAGPLPTLLPPTFPSAPLTPPTPSFITVNPSLITEKYNDKAIIDTAGSIKYYIETQTLGAVEDDTFVFDKIPDGTTITNAYTDGAITAGSIIDNPTVDKYQCDGCEVWFYGGNTGGPRNYYNNDVGYDPANPLPNDPQSLGFELGVDAGGGIWSPPVSMSITNVTWVAFGINNISPDRSIISDPWIQSYGFDVTNSDNIPGDLIYNSTATNSSSLLQSISNYVVTALIASNVYDLALVKELSPGYNSEVNDGDTVGFSLTVTNQGTVPAWNIEITDYFPETLSLVQTGGWVNTSGEAQYMITDIIPAGSSETVDIFFTVVAGGNTGEILNQAEISVDNSSLYTMNDQDSTPDSINNDCYIIDNSVTGNGLQSSACESDDDDEDDHDGEVITLVQPLCDSLEGTACNSTENSCGEVNTGMIQCNGSCDALTPSEDSCVSPQPELIQGGGQSSSIQGYVPSIEELSIGAQANLEESHNSVDQLSELGEEVDQETGLIGEEVKEEEQQDVIAEQPQEISFNQPKIAIQKENNEAFLLNIPDQYLPTGLGDRFDSLISEQGYNTYVTDSRITTSAPDRFPAPQNSSSTRLSYWKSVVPVQEWNMYYASAEAIMAIPSAGIIVPVSYPTVDGVTNPNDINGHLSYLNEGVTHRSGTASLGDSTSVSLVEGHSASRSHQNDGPFGAAMKTTVLAQPGEHIDVRVKNELGTYEKYTYIIKEEKTVSPDDTKLLEQLDPGTLVVSTCGSNSIIGTLTSRNLLIAQLQPRDNALIEDVTNHYELDGDIKELIKLGFEKMIVRYDKEKLEEVYSKVKLMKPKFNELGIQGIAVYHYIEEIFNNYL